MHYNKIDALFSTSYSTHQDLNKKLVAKTTITSRSRIFTKFKIITRLKPT